MTISDLMNCLSDVYDEFGDVPVVLFSKTHIMRISGQYVTPVEITESKNSAGKDMCLGIDCVELTDYLGGVKYPLH